MWFSRDSAKLADLETRVRELEILVKVLFVTDLPECTALNVVRLAGELAKERPNLSGDLLAIKDVLLDRESQKADLTERAQKPQNEGDITT